MSEYMPEQNEFKPRKNRKTGRIIAICLACVILAGAAGTGAGVLVASMDGVQITETGNGGYEVKQPPAADSGVDVPAPDAGGENGAPSALPGGEIPGEASGLDTQIVHGDSVINAQVEYTGKTLTPTEIYSMAVHSCVGINTDVMAQNIFGQVTSSAITGSGFIISSDGYILTNNHVIETAVEQELDLTVTLYDGREFKAEVVGREAENDVALIKIDSENLPALVMNTTGNLQVGQNVYAIGNPLGELTYTMTEGIVSALDREISVESNASINMFQISAAINSGNSGGPVLNEKGEVIGIASAKYASTGVEGLGFAIPIEDAMNIVDDLVQYGFVRGKPYFGILVRTVTTTVAEYYNWVPGAYIAAVDTSSCAQEAGLAVGDIITKLGDVEILSSSDLVLAKKAYKAGESAELTVYRNGEYFETIITFDEEGAQDSLQNG